MSGTTHERWRDELAAYLLGSLGDEGAAEVERHIEVCRECREELRWLRPALEVLPESVEPLQPSPGLRARIFSIPRRIRPLIVPSGIPSISAISEWLKPPK